MSPNELKTLVSKLSEDKILLKIDEYPSDTFDKSIIYKHIDVYFSDVYGNIYNHIFSVLCINPLEQLNIKQLQDEQWRKISYEILEFIFKGKTNSTLGILSFEDMINAAKVIDKHKKYEYERRL